MEYELKRSKPEQQGVKSGAILDFINAVEQRRTQDMDQDFHSFMLLRHGYVITEGWWDPYQKDLPHMLFSLSKSFTSTAIGFAVSEGLLKVEDYVVSYFKEECPNPTGYLAQMRIKHLLSMSTGHIVDTTDFFERKADGNWVKAFLGVPVEKEPGTHFLYNTGATYMLSVIIQKITGLTLLEYLRPRLFEPLGIRKQTWEMCPMGYNTGGFGLNVTTEDIAKFGQLYLDQGMYCGKQILPKEWIEEATGYQVDNGSNSNSDWCQGYGYQFWRCRHDAYRGDGAFGQYCIVIPKLDVVIAITGGMKDMQLPLDILWEQLLPGITEEELPESQEYSLLTAKLASLTTLLPVGQKTSMIAIKIEHKSYRLEENELKFERIAFAFDHDQIRMFIDVAGQNKELVAGIGGWIEGKIGYDILQRAVLSAIWLEDITLLIQCRFVETPFAAQLKFTFQEDRILMAYRMNVGFEEPKWMLVSGN
jgi:CubicO group peptidase (beta-lactamase class C family)